MLTDVLTSKFYLVKLLEDDDYVAPVITKWLSQDLVILFFLSLNWTHLSPKTDGITGTIIRITKVASEEIEVAFFMYPCIRQRTLFFVTLSRGKPCRVGPSLCTAPPTLKEKISLSAIFFRGGGDFAQANRCKEVGGRLHQLICSSLSTAIISWNQQ